MGRKIIGIFVLVMIFTTFVSTNATADINNTTIGYWIHGIITLDMGENEAIIDGPGTDFRIQEIPRTEPFDVYVSNDLINWLKIADDIETGLNPPTSWIEVDISPSGLSSARYLKIVDESTLYSWALKVPGSDIDAVEAFYWQSGDPYADAVIFEQTQILDMSGQSDHIDPTEALGEPNWKYVSLGGKHYIEQELSIEIDIYPRTLNLKSKGRFLMVYIEMSEGWDANNIEASTVLLNDAIPPVLDPDIGFVRSQKRFITDHDHDGKMELRLKFDRRAVCNVLEPGNNVKIKITGKLNDGNIFGGFDTIRAI